MSAGVEITGLEELSQFLTTASAEIRTEAMAVVRDTTEQAASEIRRTYPQKTGTLARRVTTRYPASTVLAGVVSSAAPHSHLYEFGTKARKTAKGWNRGVMPKASPAVTVPIATRYRVRMVESLRALVRSFGFEVG